MLDMRALRRLSDIRVDPFRHPRGAEGVELMMLYEVVSPGTAVVKGFSIAAIFMTHRGCGALAG